MVSPAYFMETEVRMWYHPYGESSSSESPPHAVFIQAAGICQSERGLSARDGKRQII